MIRRAIAASVGLAVTTASAPAQIPSFGYSIEAPASLAPGATATITVLCAFTPGVGQPVGTVLGPLPVMGLESGGFSIVGSGGSWSNVSLIHPVNSWPAFPGTIAGPNIVGAIWWSGFVPPAVPSTVNPTPVWQGTFTMPGAPVTLSLFPSGQQGVWAGPSGGLAVVANGAGTGAVANIALVPAPAGVVSVGLVSVVASTRRRRAPYSRPTTGNVTGLLYPSLSYALTPTK